VRVAILVGTAGWSLSRDVVERFPSEGTTLERYAARFPVAEINSSFHRPHRVSTWERWRDSVPAEFRFSVKVPKAITHISKLVDCDEQLDRFVGEASTLGEKLAVLLVQLPPKLAFDEAVAGSFFMRLLASISATVACEPRHLSWFSEEAGDLLRDLGVARVAADPSICEAAARPGGWPGLRYWRLHGSPVIYRSSYRDRIERYAAELASGEAQGGDTWCIFDNTASSAGAGDALALIDALAER
jgi:uncharacterized protein YecE (DUF72 family)